ncbi:MAG: CoA pyrophosphatase [Acidobacteria bacterium]|nr:CoA pyrophosphatase [Acidobacteriota bacterium]
MTFYKMEIKEHIRNCLATLTPRKVQDGYKREAAVLMPIFKAGAEYRMLLTRRTEEVETHKGQISFPGGMREEKETLLETALRETFEEIGIGDGRIEPLGRFHDYVSITKYRVTPFVGFVRTPFETKRQVAEVAEILHVPFSVFLDPTKLRVEWNRHPGREPDVYFYSFGNHEIWGLTARIIKDFFEFLDLKP